MGATPPNDATGIFPVPSITPPGQPPAAATSPLGQMGGQQGGQQAGPTGGGPNRKGLLLVGAALAVVAIVALVAVRLSGGGSGGSSALDSRGFELPTMPSSEPEEAWRAALDGVTSVATDGTRTFAAAWIEDEAELVAFGRSGEELWRERLPSGLSYVQVVDGLLLVGVQGESTESAAYDPATGDRRWRSDALPVRTLGGGEYLGTVFDGESRTVRMSGGDGRFRWETDGHLLDSCDGVALVGSYEGDGVRAVDLDDGEERWEVDGQGAACGDGRAVVGDDGRVVAYGLGDGEERWRARASSPYTISAGVVVATDDEEVLGLDLADGTELWSAQGYPTTAAVDGRLAISEGGRTSLHLLRDGEALGRAPREAGLLPTTNGWLAFRYGYDGDDAEATLFDGDLRERWSVDLDTDGESGYADGLLWAVESGDLVIYR